LLLPVEITLGGRLFLSEVVLLLALPFLLDNARRRGVSRIAPGVVALGLLWFLGLVLTDIYRGTPFEDYSRGWSKVAFILINFVALSLLIDGRWRRVSLFSVGLVLGQVLQFYITPNLNADSDPWKFGLGPPITLAGVLIASRLTIYHWPFVPVTILVALGLINFELGARGSGGVCLLSALALALALRTQRLVRLRRRALGAAAILTVIAVVGLALVEAYGYSARHGHLGERAQQKYVSSESDLGILLSGRPEILVATRAVRDSPLLGHGSWAKDPKYAAALRDQLFRAGSSRYDAFVFSPEGEIPAHSYLFGAWVEAGILGGMFWLWLLLVALSLISRLHRLEVGRVVIVSFLTILFLWNVLFSPLGAEGRLSVAFVLVVVLLAHKTLDAASEGSKNSRRAAAERSVSASAAGRVS